MAVIVALCPTVRRPDLVEMRSWSAVRTIRDKVALRPTADAPHWAPLVAVYAVSVL